MDEISKRLRVQSQSSILHVHHELDNLSETFLKKFFFFFCRVVIPSKGIQNVGRFSQTMSDTWCHMSLGKVLTIASFTSIVRRFQQLLQLCSKVGHSLS